MPKQRQRKEQYTGTVGAVLTGDIPGGASVEAFVAEHKPLCTAAEWEQLGRPVACIRYRLGYAVDNIYGYTYCHTALNPSRHIAIVLVCPSNCRGIDVGIVTPGGSHWSPASLMRVGDVPAAKDYVRRKTGTKQPISYWDYSLSEDNVARFIDHDGNVSRTCMGAIDEVPVAAEDILRAADDGNPHAADAPAGKDGE